MLRDLLDDVLGVLWDLVLAENFVSSIGTDAMGGDFLCGDNEPKGLLIEWGLMVTGKAVGFFFIPPLDNEWDGIFEGSLSKNMELQKDTLMK